MEYSLAEPFEKKSIACISKEAYALIHRGIQFVANTTPCILKPEDTSKKEYCINSTLHRGFYNPSPVYDCIVGNVKRGRICKNPLAETITHHYYYNQLQELSQIDYIYQDKITRSEWLYRENNTIYGFTFDRNMHLSAVSREVYKDNRIVAFALAHCIYDNDEYRCFKYQEENYQYDAEGICMCSYVYFAPRSNYITNTVYEFERRNGYLVSYSECSGEPKENRQRYLIRKKRKA